MMNETLDPVRAQSMPRTCVVDEGLVAEMMRECRGQTPSSLNSQFGISWNTWTKLRKRMPIRRSVAIRLVARVLADKGHDADPMNYLTERN